MAYLFIYLIQLSGVISTICILSCILSFVGLFMYFMTLTDDYYGDINKIFKNLLIVSITSAILTGLFPSKQTLLLSGATYYGTKVYKNIVTDEKVSKVNTIINLELDKQIKNLREETK